MKTLYGTIDTHLEKGVTSLCTCWSITRRDGTVYRFTDSDIDVDIGNQTYVTAGAYRRTAISNTSTLSVDNLDIEGITSEMYLSLDDMINGLYDYAEVNIFATSWNGGETGKVALRRGYFGTVEVDSNGIFKVQLRGLLQKLSHTYTDVYSATCANDLGDSKCKIPIDPKTMVEGEVFKAGAVGKINVDGTETGMRGSGGLKDGSFVEAKRDTLAASDNWLNDGTFNVTTTTSPSGNPAAYSSSAGSISQHVPIENVTTTEANAAQNSGVYIEVNAFRRDSGTTANLKTEFIGSSGETLMQGQTFEGVGVASNIGDFTIVGDWTVEAWVKFSTEAPLVGDIVAKSGQSSINVNEGILQLLDDITMVAESTSPITDSEWHHVAFVQDGLIITGYVDFELVTTVTATHSLRVDVGMGIDGSMDEVRIWNIARTRPDLFSNAYTALPPATVGLLRYYNFNNGTLTDATGNYVPALTLGALSDHSSPVGVPVGLGSVVASLETGLEDVGSTWVSRKLSGRIPNGTTYYVVSLTASAAGSQMSDLWTTATDTTTDEIGASTTNNVYWVTATDTTVPAGLPISPIAGDVFGTFVAKNAWTRAGVVTRTDTSTKFYVDVDEPRAVSGWFNYGQVIFTTGKNAGGSFEVKDWEQAVGGISLYLPTNFTVNVGDEFYIFPGCEGTRINCASVFLNVSEFNGTPDVPGHDELFRYPDAS